jgi:hypothetical protein
MSEDPKTVVSLVAGKTDAQIAEEMRSALRPHLAGMCAVFDDAASRGFDLRFYIQFDPATGRHFIGDVTIARKL